MEWFHRIYELATKTWLNVTIAMPMRAAQTFGYSDNGKMYTHRHAQRDRHNRHSSNSRVHKIRNDRIISHIKHLAVIVKVKRMHTYEWNWTWVCSVERWSKLNWSSFHYTDAESKMAYIQIFKYANWAKNWTLNFLNCTKFYVFSCDLCNTDKNHQKCLPCINLTWITHW